MPLSCMEHLREVHLIDNEIGDAAMEYLTHFDNLEVLDLACTNVTNAGWSKLPHMRGLASLRLQETGITRLRLKDMPGLKRLDVRGLRLQELHLE